MYCTWMCVLRACVHACVYRCILFLILLRRRNTLIVCLHAFTWWFAKPPITILRLPADQLYTQKARDTFIFLSYQRQRSTVIHLFITSPMHTPWMCGTLICYCIRHNYYEKYSTVANSLRCACNYEFSQWVDTQLQSLMLALGYCYQTIRVYKRLIA